jgi:3',5'-cyclic AMP phosphodiesterase CpdA
VASLLQISDPHFGTEQRPVVEALLALSRRVSPDVVVVSGDITQRARRAQFSAARAFIEKLDVPHVLSIPGNHDIPLFDLFARCFHPYANYARAFGDNLEPVFDDVDALIVCVNTTRAWRHKNGEVSEQQIRHVAERLSHASKRQLRIVVTHQPVHVVDKHDVPNLLLGGKTAVREWSTAGVDIILGGHIHLPHVRRLAEHSADSPHRTWSIQAGTAVSKRTRNHVPNSVNLIKTAFPTCVVERWDFNADACSFVQKELHTLELARD